MKNNFGSYIAGQRLARMILMQAEDESNRGETAKAVRDIIKAQKEFMVATNNFATLLFQSRRKNRKSKKGAVHAMPGL
jgi:hypothetical protein